MNNNSILLEEIPEIKNVSSDCIPWNQAKKFVLNPETSCIHANIDNNWLEQVDLIYNQYNIYEQSDGKEQPIFPANSGLGIARSERIVEIMKTHSFDSLGKVLDIGCGNGGFLKVLQQNFPEIKLYGTEYSSKYKEIVESIPNVSKMYTCNIDQISDNDFELISLIHVLEHIPNPVKFLEQVRKKLTQNGTLLIELPHFEQNPFELAIYDHASHFSVASIKRVLNIAGFEIKEIRSDWVPKEITIIAQPAREQNVRKDPQLDILIEKQALFDKLLWLQSVKEQALSLRKQSSVFALFGSSIAATWLTAELDHDIDFFIDEDPFRNMKQHLNNPIYLPENVSQQCNIFIAQPPETATLIKSRLETKLQSSRIEVPSGFKE
jgi:2-polyprenyl-3-methyl-5-hydroxy-6-metoxy-1,4-benzoquinol methylase